MIERKERKNVKKKRKAKTININRARRKQSEKMKRKLQELNEYSERIFFYEKAKKKADK